MKINYVAPQLNLDSFYEFGKMSLEEKACVLLEKAVCLDEDCEDGQITSLYFLDGYFVEETFSPEQNRVTEIIPYKRGYKIERLLQKNGLLELKDFYKN